MFFQQEFGIDLGSDTIKIYDKREDSITVEKNLVAVRNHSDVLAVGNEAFEMLGRVSADTKVSSPVESGRISDVWHAEAIIHSLLFRQHHYIGHRPSIYFAVPPDMTEIERRAYASIARRGRLRNCSIYLVEKPLADALAMGLPIVKAKGTMMINMGSVSTDLSAIADSHIILNRSVPIAGRAFDEAVAAAVRKKNRFQISLKTAEQLKLQFMDNRKEEDLRGTSVNGIDVDSGLPRNGFITAETVRSAVRGCLTEMIDALKTFLERIPPQIRDTVSREGIHLCGGSSRVEGIEVLLAAELNVPVHLSTLYENCTVRGLKEVISYTGANKLAYAPIQRR